MNFKKSIKLWLNKHNIPTTTRNLARLQYSKFERYSAILNENQTDIIITKIRILAHDLEKGFSLPHPRKGFGRKKIVELDHLLNVYEKKLRGIDDQAYTNAMASMKYYISHAKEFSFNLEGIDTAKYLSFESNLSAGVNLVDKDNLKFNRDLSFITSRHSIREYKDEPLKKEVINEALKAAQSAPSACNRESVKIFHVVGADKCQKVLDIQMGSRGFSKVNDIFIVAADLTSYTIPNEANTGIVDASLFAMNLMLSLNALGVGSCPLLWNDESDQGKQIRSLLSIPENYEIALIMTAGYYPDKYKHAVSNRKDIEQIYEKV